MIDAAQDLGAEEELDEGRSDGHVDFPAKTVSAFLLGELAKLAKGETGIEGMRVR